MSCDAIHRKVINK